jgi:thiol-disulfide isomerase/thioredoxin
VNVARPAAVLAAALISLAACGGESGPVAAPDDASSDDASPAETAVDELPDELVGLVRPVTVSGEALPPLQTDVISADPARGLPAPIISGEGFDGSTTRVDAIAGGPTMVVFLAHWCPHCNDEIPRINELRDDGRLPDDLNVVAVSTAISPGRPNFPPDNWLELKDWTFPVIADDIDFESETFVATSAMGVTGYPFAVLIDREGVVQARWSGGRDTETLLGLINSYLGV